MDENLFSQTYSQIVAKALNGNPNFQLIAAPIDFSFPTVPTGQIAPQAYQIVSRMPPWSPVGSYNTGDVTVASAFREVLSHVTFTISPTQQQAYTNLQNQVTQASNAVTAATSAMNQAYLTQKQNGGVIFAAQYPDITTWIAGPGAAYSADIANKQSNYQDLSLRLLQLQKSAMPPTLQNAIDAMATPQGDPASNVAPTGWAKVTDGSGILRWQPDWQIGTTGQEWRAQLTGGSIGSFSVDLSASDNTRDFSKSFAKGTVSITQPFWSVNASGGWQKLDLTTNDQSVTATISVKSSTLVPVTPGSWYDGGFLRGLLNAGNAGSGYAIANGWSATGAPPALFGAAGLLSTMVNGLLVVYQPSFSISMKASTLQQNKQKIDAAAGVRIGPFTFGGSGGHESEFKHTTSNDGTFTGESTSTDPLIIGVTLAFPPNQSSIDGE